jgi:predicted nucleic acid-binding protein
VSGDGILLDTNAIIYFLEGRARIAEHVLLAETIYYSVITEIELLSASHLSEPTSTLFVDFSPVVNAST